MNKSSKLLKHVNIVFVTLLLSSMVIFYSATNIRSYREKSNEIGVNEITTGFKILVDEAHVPVNGICNDSIVFEYPDGYFLFADMLINEGYTVDRLNENDTIEYSALENYDLLIIFAPTADYTAVEIATIYNWTTNGNALLLVSDWGAIFGNSSNFIADPFGYEFAVDAIYDTDDNEGNPYHMVLNETNIKSHAITNNVTEIEVYAPDGIIVDPIGTNDIIATDIDDTAMWLSGGFANNIPIVSALDGWGGSNGKLVLVSDSNLWTNRDTDGDGIINFNEGNNSILALNIVNWLSPIIVTTTAPLQGVYFSFIAVFVLLITFIRVKRKKQ
jgi:hypothetical protein